MPPNLALRIDIRNVVAERPRSGGTRMPQRRDSPLTALPVVTVRVELVTIRVGDVAPSRGGGVTTKNRRIVALTPQDECRFGLSTSVLASSSRSHTKLIARIINQAPTMLQGDKERSR